jgi:hypothetical protein
MFNSKPLESNIYIVDEIGKMEIASSKFEIAMADMLQNIDNENFMIIATVPTKSLKLSDMFKNSPRSKMFTVSIYLFKKYLIFRFFGFVVNFFSFKNLLIIWRTIDIFQKQFRSHIYKVVAKLKVRSQ